MNGQELQQYDEKRKKENFAKSEVELPKISNSYDSDKLLRKSSNNVNNEIEDIEELKGQIRKNLFWKLYRLPWIIIFLALIASNVFFIFQYKDYKELQESFNNVPARRSIDHEPLEEIIPDELPDEIETTDYVKKAIEEAFEVKEHEIFNHDNYKMARRLRMDLEARLRINLTRKVDFAINEFKRELISLEELETMIHEIIKEEILSSFEGFRVYNRIYEK